VASFSCWWAGEAYEERRRDKNEKGANLGLTVASDKPKSHVMRFGFCLWGMGTKLCKSVKAHHWVFLGLSGFRHWLQLVRCTYLLTLSKYFGWGRTFRVGWNPKLAFALKSEVMKLGRVWPLGSAFRWDGKGGVLE